MVIIESIAAFTITLAILLPFVNWYDKAKKEMSANERDN